MTSNQNTNSNGFFASSSLTEFAWQFPQEIINNKCVIFNSIITPTKITLKNNKFMEPQASYGKCFVLIDKSQIPSGSNSTQFMQPNKVAITGGDKISYDSMSPTFVDSFSDIESMHFPNAFGHLTGTVYNPNSDTTPFVLYNGQPIVTLTKYLQLSGFNPTASDGYYAQYSNPLSDADLSKLTNGQLTQNLYESSIGNNSVWSNNIAPSLENGSESTIVIPVPFSITVDLYSAKANAADMQPENSGITYSSWSCKYLGYQNTYSQFIQNSSFVPQSNAISIPSSVQNLQEYYNFSNGLFYVAYWNGNGSWNPEYFPSTGTFSDGSITFNGDFTINGISYTTNYIQNWNTSTFHWDNDANQGWTFFVTDSGKIYPNNAYTLDQIFTGSVNYTNSYYDTSVSLSSNGFTASFILPKSSSDGSYDPSVLWSANSDGIHGGDGSWLLVAPAVPYFLISGYYYNIQWSTSSSTWVMTGQGPYPALNAVTFNQVNNNTPILSNGTIIQVNVPVINYMVYNTSSRNLTDSGINDIDKIANKYYSIGDTIVQSYYNHCLQSVHYLQSLSTVSNSQENLVKYLNVAVAYNLLEPLLTEWIKGYPLTSLPQATQAIYSSLGDSSNLDDINSMIGQFFTTEVPGAVSGVTLCATSESSADNAAAATLTPSNPIPQGVSLMPNAVRFILTKTLAMGVLLEHLSSQVSFLKHAQASLSSVTLTGTLPTNEMSLTSQQSQITSLISHVIQSQYNNTQQSQSINPSLFYPTVDEITAEVMTKVQGIRDLVIDRLFGLKEVLFNEELKDILSNFSQEVHALLTDFCNIVTTSTEFITPKYPAISNIVKAVQDTVISGISHPIAFSLALVTRLVANVIGDLSNLLAPGSEILTLFEDANILRPVPVALTPTESNSLFSYATSATEFGFSNIDWWGIDYRGNLLSISNAPAANDVDTSAPDSITLTSLIPGAWSVSIPLNEGVYKQTLLTIGGLVDVWMSTMWEICSDGAYHRTGNQSIYFVPHPAVDIDGKISIPKSFHKFIVVGLLSAGLLYGVNSINAASNAINIMSQWPGFESFQSHISLAAFTTAEVADAGAATIATALGLGDLFGNASGSKEEFTIATEDIINAVKVGYTYSKAAALNVLNSVENNLNEFEDLFKSTYNSFVAPKQSYLMKFSQTATLMNQYSLPLPLYYKESGAYLFGDIIMAVAKVSGSLWVQHKIFKHFSDLSTQKKENDIKKDAVLGTLGTFALNKYHRLVNNKKRIKELDAQSKKINAAFMNEPLYEKLAQKDLSGMSKQELSDLQTDQGDLSQLINDMVDDVGSRGLN